MLLSGLLTERTCGKLFPKRVVCIKLYNNVWIDVFAGVLLVPEGINSPLVGCTQIDVFTWVLLDPESINRPLVGCCFNWSTIYSREYQSSITRMLFLLWYY
jgi:hypothetical protein